MAEAKTNMAFSNMKRGQRLQVDINDPYVQGLVRGGYLTIIWKEPDGPLADSADPAWVDCLFSDGLAAGTVSPQEGALDVAGEAGSGEGDSDGA